MACCSQTLRRAVIVAVVFIACASLRAVYGSQPAPRFHAKTIDGEVLTSESLKGKVVLLQFWATWCHYCQGEQPLVDEIDRKYAKDGLVVLAVNVGESRKAVKRYLAQRPRSCRVILMEDTNLAAMFPRQGFPYYVAIDRDGNIAATQDGAGGVAGLRHLLKQAGIGQASLQTIYLPAQSP